MKTIACVVQPGFAPFEFGLACEFGLDRSDDGIPSFDFRVVAPDPGAVPSNLRFSINVDDDLAFAEEADLVVITPIPRDQWAHVDERVTAVVRRAVERGAWVLTVCSGSFVVAAAGVLSGRRATTHWRYADTMAEMYPDIDVDPNVLYVQDGRIITSAGTAAGLDAAHGGAAAARRHHHAPGERAVLVIDAMSTPTLIAARSSEVSGLQAGDVRFDKNIVVIARQTYPGKGGLITKQTKGRRERRVPILDPLRPVLERLTEGKEPEDRLLVGPKGGALTTATVRDATNWDQIVSDLGLHDLTRHGLRHTGATWMADAGIPLHVLQDILGHASVETTRGYLHPDDRHLASAAEQPNAFLARSARASGTGRRGASRSL